MEATMRVVSLSLVLTMVFVSRGVAEERVHALPEIVIGSGAKTGAARSEGRANDELESAHAMDRLNQQLKKRVDRVRPTFNLPPIDARSPDTKVGVINIPGVQQQYGRNFGVSAVPYRPPPLVFAPPVAPHR
jgi:hypothetical protein